MIAYNTNHKLKNNKDILIELIRELKEEDGLTKREKNKLLKILENKSETFFDDRFWRVTIQSFVEVGIKWFIDSLKDYF